MYLKSKQLSQSAKAKINQNKVDLLKSLKGDKGDKGLQGDKGLDGVAGKDGAIGKAGMIGEAGPRGPQGPQGQKGDKGLQGEHGQDGEEGTNGRGIVRMQIRSFDLIVTYTDGEKVNLGRVVGDRGMRGPKGQSGYAFGDTTVTNITEEVLSPEDSENLETVAENSTETLAKLTELVMNQQCQLDKINTELKINNTHLSIMTDEELLAGDEE